MKQQTHPVTSLFNPKPDAMYFSSDWRGSNVVGFGFICWGLKIFALWYFEYQKLAFEKQHVFPKTMTQWLTTTHDNPCTENCSLVKPNASEPHYEGEQQMISLILSKCLDRYCSTLGMRKNKFYCVFGWVVPVKRKSNSKIKYCSTFWTKRRK